MSCSPLEARPDCMSCRASCRQHFCASVASAPSLWQWHGTGLAPGLQWSLCSLQRSFRAPFLNKSRHAFLWREDNPKIWGKNPSNGGCLECRSEEQEHLTLTYSITVSYKQVTNVAFLVKPYLYIINHWLAKECVLKQIFHLNWYRQHSSTHVIPLMKSSLHLLRGF